MALAHLIGEIVQQDSFSLNKVVVARWALLITAVILPILLLFIVRRKKRGKKVRMLIYSKKQKDILQTNSDNRERGKKRIEKLLYEITELLQPGEYLNYRANSSNDGERHHYEIPIYGRTNKILKDRDMKVSKHNDLGTPLDVQELKAVSTLAKQLRARSQHSIRT